MLDLTEQIKNLAEAVEALTREPYNTYSHDEARRLTKLISSLRDEIEHPKDNNYAAVCTCFPNPYGPITANPNCPIHGEPQSSTTTVSHPDGPVVYVGYEHNWQITGGWHDGKAIYKCMLCPAFKYGEQILMPVTPSSPPPPPPSLQDPAIHMRF